MAQVREYAYYVTGNTLKIVERDVNFDNDPNSKSYGPGVDRGEWKSPLVTVTDGLQLEYTYVPLYRIKDITDTATIESYRKNQSDGVDVIQFTAEESVTAVLNKWILISGSDRWNGLHQIAANSTGDTFVVKTRYNGATVTEASTVYLDVEIMEDESFEIDLPDNLNLALEYYLKAKLFEQSVDLERKEYFMKEFRKIIEKHASTRQWGAKMIASGPHAIR